jgi:hypothetical protein
MSSNPDKMPVSLKQYFDALARKLALFYWFKWGPEDDNVYPTCGDVLFAHKNTKQAFLPEHQSTTLNTQSLVSTVFWCFLQLVERVIPPQ